METISPIPIKLIIAIVIAAFIGYLIGRQTKTPVKNLTPDPVKPTVIKPDSKKFEKPQTTAENKISTDTEETPATPENL
jgi:hypothetical protein